jgi:hypothetical protein
MRQELILHLILQLILGGAAVYRCGNWRLRRASLSRKRQ